MSDDLGTQANGGAESPDEFTALCVERSGTLSLAVPVEEAFALFTPRGERLWVPGWDPKFLSPADGALVERGVFTTVAGADTTIWMVVDHVPGQQRVRYARITPDVHAVEVAVHCETASSADTTVHVRYTLTALSPRGNDEVEVWTEAWYDEYLQQWESLLSRYLAAKQQG